MQYLKHIIFGAISFVLTLIYTESYLIASISFAIVVILFFIYDPKRRYLRIFWYILSLFVTTNLLFLELVGTIHKTSYTIRYEGFNTVQSICLLIIALFSLILDYLERKENPFFLNITKEGKKTINQKHYGSGDILAGDKTVNKYNND